MKKKTEKLLSDCLPHTRVVVKQEEEEEKEKIPWRVSKRVDPGDLDDTGYLMRR